MREDTVDETPDSAAQAGAGTLPRFRDARLTPRERAEDLLARMTIAEKVAQLGSRWIYEVLDGTRLDREAATEHLSAGIGQITRLAGASNLSPRECAELANDVQRFLAEETRLGVPAIIHEECCSGYTAQDATAFPQMVGLASTWQPELARAMTREIRGQMRAVGAHQGLSPILDIGRDPRWGRIEETFGEDPYLVARMGVAYIEGLQGENPERGLADGVIATVKHFVGYSVSEGGLNWAPAHLGERELHEVYLQPFEAAVKLARVKSLMAGYHELDGVPVSASRELMTELIRERWGFDGIVVSDYMSINSLYRYHAYARDKAEASRMSLDAGVDVELPSTDCYGAPILQALEDGDVAEVLVDRAVLRILVTKFALGLFENPYVAVDGVAERFDNAGARALAREIAARSLILLENRADLLPLGPDAVSIAVIGPNADSERNLLGDYSYPAHIELLVEQQGQGLMDTPLPASFDPEIPFVPMKTVLGAIRDGAPDGAMVAYARGCEVLGDDRSGFAEAVALAERADVAVLVVGDRSGLSRTCSTGEFRDRAGLTLPGVQEELAEAVIATGTPVVVVLVNGRPVSSPRIAERASAILEAWLPGEEGADAIADALFGRINPGGKLPLTVLRSAGQVPLYYNHKPSGARSFPYGPYVDESNAPLYPFGFGLSYTRFELSSLTLGGTELRAGGSVTLELTVENRGERRGDEVVQLYVRHHDASVTRPVKELKGFQRVGLDPGERRTVHFELYANGLGYLDRDMRFVLEPGRLELMVGTSSADIALRRDVAIVGPVTEIENDKVFFSDATIR